MLARSQRFLGSLPSLNHHRPGAPMLRALLLSLLALAPLAHADELHFSTFRFGQRAMGMGGAVTAYADEPEATFYNPAGLAMLGGTRFSGALNFIGFDRRTQRGALRDAAFFQPGDLDSEEFVAIPASSVLTSTFAEGRHVLALSTFLQSDSEEDFSGSHEQALTGDTYDFVRFTTERRREDEILLRGVSWGYRGGPTWAVGASVFLARQIRREVARRAEVLQRVSNGDSLFLDVSTREESTTHGLLARVGALWRPSERWSFGIACSTPSVTVLGEGKVGYTQIRSGGLAGDDRPLLVDERVDLDATTVLPADCRAGLAWRVPDRLVVGFDVAVHLPVDYDRYTLTPALAPRADELQAHVQTDAVVNAAVGLEWRASDRWPLRVGLFTNRTAAPAIDARPAALAPAHVDLYGATASLGYLGDDGSVNVGAELQVGSGEDAISADLESLRADRDFIRVDRSEWRLLLFVSGAVTFAKAAAKAISSAWGE